MNSQDEGGGLPVPLFHTWAVGCAPQARTRLHSSGWALTDPLLCAAPSTAAEQNHPPLQLPPTLPASLRLLGKKRNETEEDMTLLPVDRGKEAKEVVRMSSAPSAAGAGVGRTHLPSYEWDRTGGNVPESGQERFSSDWTLGKSFSWKGL